MSNVSGVAVGAMQAEAFEFTLNAERVCVEGVAATTTLLDWLRAAGRTGSKCGCAEGDCGACTVALVERDAAGETTYRAINSCIALLPMFAGREIVTVEGLAKGKQLHPVQNAMVEHYGSQCGYCTPGFVVSMFEAYYRGNLKTPAQINDQLCGNLCRCTGYRPIRAAATAVLAQRDAKREANDAFAARLTRPVAALADLHYAAGGERFFRPSSLAALFAIKHRFPEAKLVAGATEIGVELNKKAKRFPALISTEGVAELTQIVEAATEWRIGAAVTLTAIEEKLAGEFPSLAKMLSVFASRQIRNRATLGGNLVTASPIGDSAPVLLTLDASVVLASTLGDRVVPLHAFFRGYRETQMRPDEVMKQIVVPRDRPAAGLTRQVDFQKVSHRRELDISIVAGAFAVDCDAGGIVRRARIAFGGVAAVPVLARRIEAALERKTLADTVDTVAEMLRSEFTPIDDVRGSAEYRRGVAAGLWRKFVSGEKSLAVDVPATFAAGVFRGEKYQAHGQDARATSDASRELRHESAVGHVTGRAQYVDDVAQGRSILEVSPVMAPHARAKIVRRNASVARAMPGVAAVLMAEDVPGQNNVGVSRHDETLFAAEAALYDGHIVALVVGDSLAACRAAAARVEVEYESLTPVLTIAEAEAQNSFHTESRTMTRGDCAGALAAAARRLAGEFSFGGQEHFYLETQAAWAECGDEGDLRICCSTQHPSEIQAIVAEVLDLPRHKIVVEAPRMGGGFGGKETQGNTPAALVALAALKTGRPVRVQFDRDVDMT
ncbi:MAG: xanthine dehydrogenase small subunit, partial [Opitutaceae bacterium]